MSVASCAACRPASVSAITRTATAGGIRSPCCAAVLSNVESAVDSTYSMTRKSSPGIPTFDPRSVSTTSITGTTFGWRTIEATRASSRSMSTKSLLPRWWRCTRLTTTRRSKPAAPTWRAT
jgi:hypothetical protein